MQAAWDDAVITIGELERFVKAMERWRPDAVAYEPYHRPKCWEAAGY